MAAIAFARDTLGFVATKHSLLTGQRLLVGRQDDVGLECAIIPDGKGHRVQRLDLRDRAQSSTVYHTVTGALKHLD